MSDIFCGSVAFYEGYLNDKIRCFGVLKDMCSIREAQYYFREIRCYYGKILTIGPSI